MAYERAKETKTRGEGLDVYVESVLKMFGTQMASRNAQDELVFNQAVLENNLSLDEQLSYRQEQLKRVADNPEERKRVKLEIANLKDRIEQKKFSDDYLGKIIDFNSGVSSIDSIIKWLEDKKSVTTDMSIKSTIDSKMAEMQQKRFSLEQTMIQNQTDYAVRDKSDSVINSQIDKVASYKNKALLAGNEELVSVYDLQIQSLTQAKNVNSIEKDIKNFAVLTAQGYTTATQLLDAYNAKISSASKTGSVTIGGVSYNSPQEFWSYKRDSFLSDNSENGFFGMFKGEQESALKLKSSTNSLSQADVASSGNAYTSLTARPELAAFQTKININRQDSLQSGADLLAKKVYYDYLTDYDINKAVSNLNLIKSMAVNVDDYYTQILLKGSDIKESQVSSILNKVNSILNNPQDPDYNPGLTPEQAINKAMASGEGVIVSPQQMISKTTEQITKEQTQTAGKAQEDPRLTTATPTAPQSIANPQTQTVTGQYVKYKGDDSVYDISTGTARYIPFEEAQQKNIWGQIKEVDTIPNIPNPVKQQASAVSVPSTATSKMNFERLITVANLPQVYGIYQGKKYPIQGIEEFNALKLDNTKVEKGVRASELDRYQLGEFITPSNVNIYKQKFGY